jgi:type I restriction enzyme S subunit
VSDQEPRQANGGESVSLPALPSGWCWTTLETIANIEGGITKDQKRQRTGTMREVPYLRVANVQRGFLDLREIKTILADEEEIQTLRLEKGDILFTEGGDRDKLGRGWVWNGEIDECIHQNHIFRARPVAPLFEPKYVSYHGNFFGQQWFTKTGKQTTNLASINKGVLRRFPVPLAPLQEQRRILAKIEELFSDFDAGVATLQRARAKVQRYRAAVLQATVEGRLTEDWRAKHPHAEPASSLLAGILKERQCRWGSKQSVKHAEAKQEPSKDWQSKYQKSDVLDSGALPHLPQGWCWARVEQVGVVQLGRQRSPQHHNGPHMRPYLRVANVYEDRIDLSDIMQMNFTPDEYETYHLEYGDILLNEGQSLEWVGRPAMYRGEVPGSCFQNTLVRFRSSPAVLPLFALYVFRAYLHNQRFQRIARWTVNIAHLGAERFSKIEFPLPPLEEQGEIVRAIEARLSVVDQLEAQIEANVKRAARLRQSILKRAFDGELVEQDPNDEPADKLLERIRAAGNGMATSPSPEPKHRGSKRPSRRTKQA